MRFVHRTAALALAALAGMALAGANGAPQPADETAYLRELSRLHATDPEAALDYARKGDDWYSATGARAEARKAMAVTLLVDLGRMDEARRETRAFMSAFPRSAYLPLVQGVTGIHPRPHGPSGN